jgi:class 3 adenylate cyclase
MKPLVTERTIDCRSDVCSLWTLLTDTDRLNRAVGMEKIHLEPLSDGTAARYLATTSLGGFTVKYEERPYEWVYPKSFKVLRRMRSGPLSTLQMEFHLAPTALGGTTVTLRLTLAPRVGILRPFMGFMSARTLGSFQRAITELDAAIVAGAVRPTRPPTSAADGGALRRARDALLTAHPDKAGEIERLVAHVRDAEDADAARIRPFALADEWRLDRRRVLAVCLASVRAGLLELRWEVVCPSCRTASDVLPSLASLTEHGACQLCEIDFAVDLAEAVEATFTPARAIRDVDGGPYCVGGPARTPHVLAQSVLPPHGASTIAAPSDPGNYRLFVRGGAATRVEVRAGAGAEASVDASSLGAREAITLDPDGVVHVLNPTGEEKHAKLEMVTWSSQAASANEVTTMPEFRRDFSSDVLRPGTALRVARVGIFFSDLTGSTQLYANVGDAAAFKLVHDHFDLVIAELERARGTLVKTIGDAVMAVFVDELDGLRASLAILEAFEAFRGGGDHRDRTHIKLGLFAGPCYVVSANGALDYFGQTVNVGARLQGEAKSGELVVEATLAERAIAEDVLRPEQIVERYDATLKGVDGPIRVARIRARP